MSKQAFYIPWCGCIVAGTEWQNHITEMALFPCGTHRDQSPLSSFALSLLHVQTSQLNYDQLIATGLWCDEDELSVRLQEKDTEAFIFDLHTVRDKQEYIEGRLRMPALYNQVQRNDQSDYEEPVNKQCLLFRVLDVSCCAIIEQRWSSTGELNSATSFW